MQESIPSVQPKHEEIATLAYLIWEKNGRPADQDVQFWHQAVQELTFSPTTAAPVESSAAPTPVAPPVETAATPAPTPPPAKAKANGAKKTKAKMGKG